MEVAADDISDVVQLFVVLLMTETVKAEIKGQFVLTQLQFAKSYVFPDFSWEVVTDIGESGDKEQGLDGNGNNQFELDDDGKCIFSSNLSDDKKALLTVIRERKFIERLDDKILSPVHLMLFSLDFSGQSYLPSWTNEFEIDFYLNKNFKSFICIYIYICFVFQHSLSVAAFYFI